MAEDSSIDNKKIEQLEAQIQELTDFAHLMANLWQKADAFIWESAQLGMVNIGQYPCIQGTGNRMAIERIAQHPFDNNKALSAMRALDSGDRNKA